MGKRLISVFTFLIVTIFAVTGCSKDPVKLFTKAVDKTSKIEKLTQTVDFDMKLDLGETEKPQDEFEAQMQAQLAALFSNIKGNMSIKYDMKAKSMYGDGSIGLGGVSLNTKMFMKDNKFAVQVPMFPKYVTMDMSDIEKDADKESKANAEFIGKMYESFSKTVTKDKITLNENAKVNIGGSDIDTSEIVLKLSSEDVKKLITDFMDNLYTNPKTKAFIFENQKKSPENQGLSDDEINKKIEAELNTAKENLKKTEIKDFLYKANIDKNSYIVQENISFMVVDLSEGKGGSSSFNFTVKRTDIGKEVNFEMPKLDSSNSVDINDMKNQGDILQPNL